MSMGTCWATGSWASPSWASGSWAGSGVAAIVLVESPTHLDQPTRVGKVGDTITITDTLRGRDKKTPQDLTGATVTFSLAGPDNALIITDQPATILDATAGKVRYVIAASVAIPAGACTFAFRATWNADTVLSFPDA